MPKVVSIQSISDTWDRLNSLAEKRGIRVFLFPETSITELNHGMPADGYWLSQEGTNLILIGKSLKGRYRNFVLAHELGHAVLHGDSGNKAAFNKRLRGPREAEADRFALRLLHWLNRRQRRSGVILEWI